MDVQHIPTIKKWNGGNNMKGNMAFINEFHVSPTFVAMLQDNKNKSEGERLPIEDYSLHLTFLFSQEEMKQLHKELESQTWIPVGIDGIKSNYKKGDTIGSYRLSCYEKEVADALWERIKHHFPTVRHMNPSSPTDWDNHEHWEPIGINPLLRFIRYNKNGFLVPHYDGPFIQDENIRSLSSFVMYLTNNEGEGGTRFLRDSQTSLPLSGRDYSDWTREASETDVYYKVQPEKGDGLIFDHRVLHDSEKIKSEDYKIIIRTDIMYRRVL